MEFNHKVESFLSNPASWVDTLTAMEKSRGNNLNFTLVNKLKSLFAQSPSVQIEAISDVIKNEHDAVLDIILKESTENLSTNDFYVYPIAGHSTAFAQRIILDSNDDFDLSIDFIDQKLLSNYKSTSKRNLKDRGISFYGRETLTFFIKSGNMRLSNWEHDLQRTNLNLAQCEHTGDIRVSDGECIYKKANETYMFEESEGNAVLISLELKRNKSPISLMFSAYDYQLKFQNPSDEVDSRVQLHISLLKTMDYQIAIPTIKKFLNHPQHYMRWYAMQQLLGMDALQVIDELESMAKSDPHHEVQQAASQTWDIVQSQLLQRAS
ncbi:HEAT repeat domain-containing protein [Shewanella sp. HL-SH5]|uniref:HEAT repeat domain-containing protein n=1 Tax=unclassified Shewanella TaxID=196818 RepID=UPI003EBCB1B7